MQAIPHPVRFNYIGCTALSGCSTLAHVDNLALFGVVQFQPPRLTPLVERSEVVLKVCGVLTIMHFSI